MISPAVLERPGYWRLLGLGGGLLLLAAPVLPLLSGAFEGFDGLSVGNDFEASVGRSLAVGAGAAALALVLGFPAGLTAGLYRFPGRAALLASLVLPLLLPSFLWAIGLSMLRVELGLPRDSVLSGMPGSVLAFAALGVPLVTFATLLATRALPGRAVDAARLAGGERAVLRYAAWAAMSAGVAAAGLAGVVSITDPGPGQILGFPGAGTEILISFSARYDFPLAARQSLATAGVVLLVGAPLILAVGRHFASALLAQSATVLEPRTVAGASWAGQALLAAALIVTLGAPVVGLAGPAYTQLWLDRILDVLSRTAGNTLVYGAAAGAIATLVAIPLVICAARVGSLRVALLVALAALFVLPPAMGALGTAFVASGLPAWLDPLARSRFTVALILGLRLTPIAAVILLRAALNAPPSWAYAAALHGVGLGTYLRNVLLPWLARPAAVSIALVGLLATADVTTVLLLQPPGRDSLPVALFTIMANAPESMVASLSLAYAILAGLGIGAVLVVLRIARPRAARLIPETRFSGASR